MSTAERESGIMEKAQGLSDELLDLAEKNLEQLADRALKNECLADWMMLLSKIPTERTSEEIIKQAEQTKIATDNFLPAGTYDSMLYLFYKAIFPFSTAQRKFLSSLYALTSKLRIKLDEKRSEAIKQGISNEEIIERVANDPEILKLKQTVSDALKQLKQEEESGD